MSTDSLAPVHIATIDLVDPARHRIFPNPADSTTDFLITASVISLVSEKSFVARLTIMNGADAVNIALANMPTIEMTVAAVDDSTTSPTVLASRSIGGSIIEVDAANGVVDFICPPQALLRYYATNFVDQNNGSCRIAFRLVNTAGEDVQFHDNVNIEDNEFSNQGGTPPAGFTVVVTDPSSTQSITADLNSAIPLQVVGHPTQAVNIFEAKDDAGTAGIFVDELGELTATQDPTAGTSVANRDYNDIRYLPRVNELSVPPTGQHTLVAADAGKLVHIDTDLIVPAGLGSGFTCEVFCDNVAAQTLDVTAVTLKGNALANISAGGTIKVRFLDATDVLITGETEA